MTYRIRKVFLIVCAGFIASLPAHMLDAQTSVSGPILEMQNTPLRFDTVHCGQRKSRTITLRNGGDSVLYIRSIGVPSAPFSGAVTYAALTPGQTRNYTFSYDAGQSVRVDSQRVFFRADSRVSMSIAIMIDVGGSMSSAFGSSTRIAAAHDAADSLINDLLLAATVQDEAAVYSFSESATLLQGYTTNHSALLSSLPTIAAGSRTCLFDAVIRGINDVRQRPNPPVVILLTNGRNSCPGSSSDLQQVILSARQFPRPVRIFTVDIGSPDPQALRDMADSTGGWYQSAADPESLTKAFRRIATLLSRNILFSFRMDAETVAPLIAPTPTDLDFGGVNLGQTACLPVNILNPGNAPLHVTALSLPAPFSVQTALPVTIAPGSGESVSICFTPRAPGYVSSTADLDNSSCALPLLHIPLKGVGFSNSNAVLGPILRIDPDPLDFDTTFCGTAKCLDLTFINVGDTALSVRSMPDIPAPFGASLPVPFSLDPGQSRVFRVCYSPPDAPRLDTFLVDLRADTRVSLSIGLLFDVSGSMSTAMADGVQRIVAAKQAGLDFVASLIDTLGVRDEAAVFAFSSAFTVRRDFTSDKLQLAAGIQALAAGGSTRLFDSMIEAAGLAQARVERRVLIVLADGDNNVGSAVPADVISAASAAGVVIFTVGIGEADPGTLTDIATQTGGRFFSATSTTDLVSVYRQIASLLSTDTPVAFRLRGRGVTPYLMVDPAEAALDSTMVGQTRCMDFLLRNTGDAPLATAAFSNGNPMFAVQGAPPVVAPGSSAALRLCFTPTRLRTIRDTVVIAHNGCSQPDVILPVMGIGYDSVTVSLTGTYASKPGSLAVFPVRLLDDLPVEYEVASYRVVLRYNSTLLGDDRLASPPGESPLLSASSLSAPLSMTGAVETHDGGYAVLTCDASGGTLHNPAPDSLLFRLNLRALLGNAPATDVTLEHVRFADGNPRVGLIKPARFELDSLCYLDRRLLDGSRRITGMLKQNVPNPFSFGTRIGFAIREEGPARLTVHDSFGRIVGVLHDAWTQKGDYEAVLDGSELPPGAYHCRLQCGGGSVNMKILLVR